MRGARSWPARLRRGLALLVLAGLAISLLLVVPFRWLDPPTSAFMLRDRVLASFDGGPDYRFRHQWADWDQISANAAMAVVAAEDQKFASHLGFDLQAIDKAVRDAKRGRRLRGASTISQQVAKNLYLWPGQSFVRKGLEAWFTLLIESTWPKQRILEVYLNVAEFGRGTFGVEAASLRFFGRPARRLQREQAALLAAVLPNPIRYRVDRPSAYVLKRQRWILRQMSQLGGRAYLDSIDEPVDEDERSN
jgi:monofunctional biosynthetic peptidoglycan transglycosylase